MDLVRGAPGSAVVWFYQLKCTMTKFAFLLPLMNWNFFTVNPSSTHKGMYLWSTKSLQSLNETVTTFNTNHISRNPILSSKWTGPWMLCNFWFIWVTLLWKAWWSCRDSVLLCFFHTLTDCLLLWVSRLQFTFAHSIMDIEYQGLSARCHGIILLFYVVEKTAKALEISTDAILAAGSHFYHLWK